MSSSSSGKSKVLRHPPGKVEWLLCQACGGRGVVQDPRVTGSIYRNQRLQTGISLTAFAHRLHFSAAYLSDLELGKRNWNTNLESQYRAALKEIT